MRFMGRSVFVAALVILATLFVWRSPVAARQPRASLQFAARTAGEVREWNGRLRGMQRDGRLRLRQRREDFLVEGRTHERFDQYFRGVRVFGADVSQQFSGGQLISAFGRVYGDITIETTPEVDAEAARQIVMGRSGAELGPGRQPELVVLPLENGRYALSWTLRAASGSDVRLYFVDAHTGAIIRDYSVTRTQNTGAVGRATGVLGDSKKISVSPSAGTFLASDLLRPPSIVTYDLRGDVLRTIRIINGFVDPVAADIASDTDNLWTDGAAADAHVYTGWTYDYFFKRFGLRGLDNADLGIRNIVHPVRRQDVAAWIDIVPEFFANAAYFGEGLMVYGVGFPPGRTLTADFFSGGLDVVGHELTHGVTEYSSNLIYERESGALNEAFSDIMATSIEHFFQEPGPGLMQADYLLGEDVFRPGGFRSMSDPVRYGDPDHYTRRYTGEDDNGGVHTNSAIVNHAFYLAIEGGANRTSGLSVEGVGHDNREQIEQVFFRAFTQMLNADATFATARAATIQAARDLHGPGSAAEHAVAQAWTAVGIGEF